MRNSIRFFILTSILSSTLIMFLVGCSCAPTTTSDTFTINVSSNITLGTFLVDGKGITLYWTTEDAPDESNISGSTLNIWPVFYVSNVIVPSLLNASDFGNILRPDGSYQTTYKFWPLYYYADDIALGQTGGQGLGGKWSVVSPDDSGPQPVSPMFK